MAIDFLTLLECLADTGLEFVIVGGVGSTGDRVTGDIDMVPALDAERWSRAIDALWTADARPRIPESRERIRDVAQIEGWVPAPRQRTRTASCALATTTAVRSSRGAIALLYG